MNINDYFVQDNNYHKIIIDSITGGMQISQLLYDEEGQVIDYLFLDVNTVFAEAMGLSKEEIVGKKITDFYPNTEPEWFIKFGKIVKSGKSETFEMWLGPRCCWFEVLAVPLGDHDTFAIVATDITQRKEMEEKLREVADTQVFLLNLNDIMRTTLDLTEVHANVTSAAMDYFKSDRCYYCEIENDKGIIRQDSHKKGMPSVSDVYSLSSLPIQKSLIESGQPFVVNDIKTTNMIDETLRQIYIQLKIISYIHIPVVKAGNTVGLLSITQSEHRKWTEKEIQLAVEVANRTWITVERVKADEALKKSEKKALTLVDELEKADKNKDEFINILAHELRNPLATIKGGIQLLEIENKNEGIIDLIRILERQTSHLTKLVDDLLDITRIIQKKVILQKEIVPLNSIVKDSIEDIKLQFEEKGIQVLEDIDTEPIFVNVDSLRITECIGNILGNALKFTEDKGRVNISLKTEEENAVIEIQDNGIGISQEMLTSIYTPFKQDSNPSVTQNNKGIGLGLSIVKNYIEMHNGDVTASSPGVGKGSKFTLRLPIAVKQSIRDTL